MFQWYSSCQKQVIILVVVILFSQCAVNQRDSSEPLELTELMPRQEVYLEDLDFACDTIYETEEVDVEPRYIGLSKIEQLDLYTKEDATKSFFRFYGQNVKYPTLAAENGIEGIVLFSFVVNEYGDIGLFDIIQEPGSGLGDEIFRLFHLMRRSNHKWLPASKNQRNVCSRVTMSMSFKLQN